MIIRNLARLKNVAKAHLSLRLSNPSVLANG